MLKRYLTLMALALSTGAASTAEATSGTVSGRIMFYQNQGNYCPTNRDCTGALYPQSEFNAYAPASDAIVYVKDANETVLGQGVTDAAGYFTVSYFNWFYVPSVKVTWQAEHKDGRFAIRSSSGLPWNMWTDLRPAVDGGNVDFGVLGWGGSGSPHTIANVYDGAYKMWRNGLSSANRMFAYFTSLEVRAFHNVTTDDGQQCPTSCATPQWNRIYLDGGAPYAPQARIMHEMGHIASYKASQLQRYAFGGDYMRDGTAGWTMRSAEYDAVNFEEGFASFLADAALHQPWAPQPHTCLIAAAACPTGTFNLESSVGLRGTCQVDEGRFALSVDRFLWDTYDSVQDSNYYTYVSYIPRVYAAASETSSHPYWAFLDMVSTLEAGTNDNEKDEPWCWTFQTLCDRDGRSSFDLKVKFGRWRSDTLDLQRINNCSPGTAG